jgi:hypothetical protein
MAKLDCRRRKGVLLASPTSSSRLWPMSSRAHLFWVIGSLCYLHLWIAEGPILEEPRGALFGLRSREHVEHTATVARKEVDLRRIMSAVRF